MSGIQDYKVTDTTGYKVADTPGDSLSGTVAQNKATFDKLAELIISKFNDALDFLHTQGIDSGVNNSALSAYPVGAIYLSVDSTSPTTLFGGTWQQIQGKFLLAASSTYTAGSTGGSADSTLPAHSHEVNLTTGAEGLHSHTVTVTIGAGGQHYHKVSSIGYPGSKQLGLTDVLYGTGYGNEHSTNTTSAGSHTHAADTTINETGQHTHTVQGDTASAGSSGTGANMPPYLSVYVWKRTA